MVAISQYFINRRVYASWGLEEKMTTFLSVGFTLFMGAMGILTVMVGLELQKLTHYTPLLHACGFDEIPKLLPYLLGILAGFDLFLIILAGYSALERPHQSNSEALSSFLRYGATLFLFLTIFRLSTSTAVRLCSFIVALVGKPTEAFAATCVAFVLNSILVSRIHLRLEHVRATHIAIETNRGKSFLVI
ncbi:hypothetical protein PM082_011674 [Marasmius tenuissimus]|nr:hypothetical protein PM082_011674 [Marasmius tenuissimus]